MLSMLDRSGWWAMDLLGGRFLVFTGYMRLKDLILFCFYKPSKAADDKDANQDENDDNTDNKSNDDHHSYVQTIFSPLHNVGTCNSLCL